MWMNFGGTEMSVEEAIRSAAREQYGISDESIAEAQMLIDKKEAQYADGRLSVGQDGVRDEAVYEMTRNLVSDAVGKDNVIEVSDAEAREMIGNKKSSFNTGKANQEGAEVPAISSDDVAKIQQNLEDKVEKYENISNRRLNKQVRIYKNHRDHSPKEEIIQKESSSRDEWIGSRESTKCIKLAPASTISEIGSTLISITPYLSSYAHKVLRKSNAYFTSRRYCSAVITCCILIEMFEEFYFRC